MKSLLTFGIIDGMNDGYRQSIVVPIDSRSIVDVDGYRQSIVEVVPVIVFFKKCARFVLLPFAWMFGCLTFIK